MKSLIWLILIGLLCLSGCGGHSTPGPTPEPSNWIVTQQDNILEIAYGSGTDFPQYAALDLKSGYLRMVYGPQSGWGTSTILLPSFWEVTQSGTEWEQIVQIDNTLELAVSGNTIYALSQRVLAKSDDLGLTWQNLPIGLVTGLFNSIDIDGQEIYLATRNGVVVSHDLGQTFSWSINWTWDSTTDVDFQDGYGWSVVGGWGSRSGPSRYDPALAGWRLCRGNIPWANMSLGSVVVDLIDPLNIVYVRGGGGYRTIDGGEHWIGWFDHVVCACLLDGKSTAFTPRSYTQDRGETWQPLGITTSDYKTGVITKDNMTENLFAVTSSGVYKGRPGAWEAYGLEGKDIRSLAICGDYLFAANFAGNIFRTNIRSNPPTHSVYHQGAPVTYTNTVNNENLILSIFGTISSLNVSAEVSFSPPAQDTFTANVTVSVDGNVKIDNRPGEAFKPLMLSSMYISPTSWDTRQAYVGTQTYPIPTSGWIIQSPEVGQIFGLVGGTSSWKENAPTIEIKFNQLMSVTGWITESSDPNDDNVGFWPASDEVLRSWQYSIVAKRSF